MQDQFIVKFMAVTWFVPSSVHRIPSYHVAKRRPNDELQSQSRTSDVYRSCAVPYSCERSGETPLQFSPPRPAIHRPFQTTRTFYHLAISHGR